MYNLLGFLGQIIKDTGKGVKGYIRSQLIIMLINFIILGIGLTIIDISYPILISAGVSILDTLPIIGSGVVMIPWSIISLIAGNKEMGINLAIIYVVLVIIRQIIEPRIMGKQMGVRPLYTFAATILGSMVLGPIGVIIGPLVAVMISSIIKTEKEP